MTRLATVCLWTGVLVTLASGAGCTRGEVAYRATARPPTTRVDTVTDTVDGVTLTDDYRWLEGASHPDGSNPGQTPSDVAAWTTAQRSYTRTVLDAVPGRADVAAKLAALMDVGDVSVPLMSGNRYFFWHRQASEQSPTVFVRDGALGVDRALLRPDDLTAAGLVSTRWIMPSPDGRWLAFGLFAAATQIWS